MPVGMNEAITHDPRNRLQIHTLVNGVAAHGAGWGGRRLGDVRHHGDVFRKNLKPLPEGASR